ncbi:MAG: hypothetical protein FWD89_03125 [Firmicutes bacterium]|nr:hypothetical protein [Bacillota bacterium]MCL2771282.1 hypothetical protein [Bacillota bacterium]
MKITSLTCQQCGGQLELTEEKGLAICSVCETKSVVKDEVVQHVRNVTHHTTKIVHGYDRIDSEDYARNGDTFMELGEWAKARDAYQDAIDDNPSDWRGWVGMLRIYTGDFTDFSGSTYEKYNKKLAKWNEDEEYQHYMELFEAGLKEHEEERQEMLEGFEGELAFVYWNGDGDDYFYPAKIANVKKNGTATANFLDGEVNTVTLDEIVSVEDAFRNYALLCNWKNKGDYGYCSIVNRNPLTVKYHCDGGVEKINISQLCCERR